MTTLTRSVGAAAALGVAAAHVPITGEHLHEAPYIGVLFVLLEITCVVLAAALVLRDDNVVWVATGAVTGAALVAYLLSRTVGLPQIGDDVGNWTEPLGVVSVTIEAFLLLMSAGALLVFRRGRRSLGERTPGGLARG